MVRAHMKQSSEEKKESSAASEKKRIVSKQKKNTETGVWPCKINGCNKEFAREADLKRHQRTTKLHSQPGFNVACPQCEATFTRTDALRRHQKSRHNGVILEPINSAHPERSGDEDDSRSLGSQSRSGTPSKGNGMGSSTSIIVPTTAPVPTMLTRPDTSGATSGTTSYYRSHTINPVFVPPRTPHGILDTSYQITQLPTSATRLHGTTWPPAPPWVQENPNLPRGGSGPTPYATHATPYYPPGSYYRTSNGVPSAPPVSVSVQVATTTAVSSQKRSSGSPEQERQSSNSTSPHASPSVPPSNIDPSLADPPSANASSSMNTESQTQPPPPDATSITDHAGFTAAVQQAIQAVLAIDPSINRREHPSVPAIPTNGAPSDHLPSETTAVDGNANPTVPNTESNDAPTEQPREAFSNTSSETVVTNGSNTKDKEAEMDVDADGEADPDGEGEVNQTQNIMMAMEIVPMLRPDELLNEESLASPPPS